MGEFSPAEIKEILSILGWACGALVIFSALFILAHAI